MIFESRSDSQISKLTYFRRVWNILENSRRFWNLVNSSVVFLAHVLRQKSRLLDRSFPFLAEFTPNSNSRPKKFNWISLKVSTMVQNRLYCWDDLLFTFRQAREWLIEWVSKQISAADCASKAISVEQASEHKWVVGSRMDQRVAQYLHLDSLVVLNHRGTL